MKKKNITIYDIAGEAHVSVATVSRVLTGSAPVREETRCRVQRLIDKYDFRPNALARSLYTKETKTIGVILPSIENPFFSSVFLESEKRALELGYTMLLCNSLSDNDVESRYLEILTSKQVDGILWMGGRINDAHVPQRYVDEVNSVMRNTPIIMVNGRVEGVDCCCVRTDEQKGFFELVRYLVELGHRKIGFIGGLEGVTAFEDKLRALKDCIQLYGLECRDEWIVPGQFSLDSGRESMKTLLQRSVLPTAVIAVNDLVAVGAVKAARDQGLEIPRDLSIVGFDNIFLAEIFSPGITTVGQDCRELGRTAVDVLLDIRRGEGIQKETILSPELIVRKSCRPAEEIFI